MTIYVDIDGTICRTEGRDYENAVPIEENIAKINRLYDEGHIINYWTSRGTTSGKDWFFVTHDQLYRWGCKHNSIFMGKPPFDLLIDDRTKRIEEI